MRFLLLGFGFLGYQLLFRLLSLTVVTYLLATASSDAEGRTRRFQEVLDAFGAHELTLHGLGALLFLILMVKLEPITRISAAEIISPYRIEKRFVSGLLQGATLACVWVAAVLGAGIYTYVGFFIQIEGGFFAALSLASRLMAIVVWVYAQEYWFRFLMLGALRSELTRWVGRPKVREWIAIAIGAAFHSACLAYLFDLGTLQWVTLLLASITLGVRATVDGDFTRGAGFWAGILVAFQILMGLPILGQEFQGLLQLQYQPGATDLAINRIVSGGYGGPLSAFAFQVLLGVDLLQQMIKHKKILFR